MADNMPATATEKIAEEHEEEQPLPSAAQAPQVPQGANAATQTSIPGVYVDMTKFVVLASRLGRTQKPLPKIDPKDPNETTKYFVPDPFERGDIISVDDIYTGPATGYKDNIERLISLRAIGYLNDPEAQEAITGLNYRRAQEESAARPLGVV